MYYVSHLAPARPFIFTPTHKYFEITYRYQLSLFVSLLSLSLKHTPSYPHPQGRALKKHQSRERMFDIENVNRTTAQPPETFRMVLDAVEDPIGADPGP